MRSRMPLTVTLVSPSFAPRVGGVETVVGQLADRLYETGHGVRVITHQPRSGGAPDQPRPYPVERYRDWTGTKRFEVAPGIRRAVRREPVGPGVVHAHSFHGSAALMACGPVHAPFVFTPHFHGVGHTRAARVAHAAYDRIAGRLFDRAAVVTCVSQAEADLLAEHYPRAAAKTVVIPNGLDLDDIAVADPFETSSPVVLVAGRLESYKQVDLAIRAMARVTDARLVICGNGPERPHLERLTGDLGLGHRVEFEGFVATPTLRRWQRTAHCTLSLSRHEAFGLTMLEAAAAGSFTVVSDIPAHRELARVAGDSYLPVAASADAEEVAAAITQACSQARPVARRDGILSWADHTERTVAAYREAIAVAA
jgi:glycosyltransferase involved in cell wall biosynthesis